METVIEKQAEQEVRGAMILATNLVKQYQTGGITTNQQNEQAGTFLKDIRGKIKLLNDKRLSMTRPLDEAKKKIMDFFSVPIDKLKLADNIISQAMSHFFQQQEQIRQAEEAKIKAKADEEVRKLAARAEKAEATGKDSKAEDLRQKAEEIQATVPVVESKVEKVSGVSMRTYYYAEAVDEEKLLKSHPEFFSLNQQKLNKYAEAMKGTVKIDGVRFWSETKPIRTR